MKNKPYNEFFPITKLYEEIISSINSNKDKPSGADKAGEKQLQRLIERTFGKNARVPIPLKDFYVDYFKPMFDNKTSNQYSEVLNKIDKNKPTSREENVLIAEHFYKCLGKVENVQLKRYLADRFLFKYSRELDAKFSNILEDIQTELDLLTGLNVYQDALDLAQEYEEIIKTATKNWKEKVLSKIEDEERRAEIIESINIKKTKHMTEDGKEEIFYSVDSENIKKFKSVSADQVRKILSDNDSEIDAKIIKAFNAVRDEFDFEDSPKPIRGKSKEEVIERLMREY